jgi:hypothetical protein
VCYYGAASARIPQIAATLWFVLGPPGGLFQAVAGRRAYHILPRIGWGPGAAEEWIATRLGQGHSTLTIRVAENGGRHVMIRAGTDDASMRLSRNQELMGFLHWLAERAQK